MPSFNIIKQCKASDSYRVKAIMGLFDLQSSNIIEQFSGEISFPDDWQIGLIVGNSGTGKTTIAKQLFPNAYITNYEYFSNSVIDDMPKDVTVQEISKTFNSVGFSSPPSWLKPYNVLSNGQKMRVDLARSILSKDDLIVFDEFTSVVDRQIAQISSYAIQKAIRKTQKKFIAVTCHFDVKDWLLPDWEFSTNTMSFNLCDKKKDHQLNLKSSTPQTNKYGKCLKSIII